MSPFGGILGSEDEGFAYIIFVGVVVVLAVVFIVELLTTSVGRKGYRRAPLGARDVLPVQVVYGHAAHSSFLRARSASHYGGCRGPAPPHMLLLQHTSAPLIPPAPIFGTPTLSPNP